MADVIRNVKLRFTVEGAQSAKDAAAGVEKAVEKTGEAAKKTGGPGGGLTSLNDSLKATTDRFNKATTAVEGVMASLGRIGGVVGLAVAAFTVAAAAAKALGEALFETGDGFKVLTEESVKAKTGLTNLQGPLDAYARSLGLANAALLTFGQRQAALAQLNNGGGAQTFDVLRQRAEALAPQIEETEAMLRVAPEGSALRADLERRLSDQRGELATLERSQVAMQRNASNAAIVAGWNADGGAGENETLARIGSGRGGRSGGGGRARPEAPSNLDIVSAPLMDPLSSVIGGIVGDVGGAGGGGMGFLDSGLGGLAAAQAVLYDFGKAGGAVDSAKQAFMDIKKAMDEAFAEQQMQDISDRVSATFEAFGRGLAQNTAAAIFYGNSFKKVANEATKALAVQAGGEALYQTARGFALLANPVTAPQAAFAFKAAGIFAAISLGAATGAAATGGFGGGGGGAGAAAGRVPSRDDFGDTGRGASDGGMTNVTVVIGGKAINDSVVAYSRGAAGSRSQPRVAVVQG